VIPVTGGLKRPTSDITGFLVVSFNSDEFDPNDVRHVDNFTQILAGLKSSTITLETPQVESYLRMFGESNLIIHHWIACKQFSTVDHGAKTGQDLSNQATLLEIISVVEKCFS
jgi:hypothetical protein